MSNLPVATHFPHLEDLVFLGNNLGEGCARVLDIVGDWIRGDNPTQYMTLKWDGSPSLVMGKDPMTQKHFVATKSIFNKIPKVNYTAEDIVMNHGKNPNLCKVLFLALDLTHRSTPTQILQGDMLYTPEDLKYFTFDGLEYLGFKTNTIQYAVKKGSPEANRIMESEMGIHFHSTLIGQSVTSLRSIYYVDPLSIGIVQGLYPLNTLSSSKILPRNVSEEIGEQWGRVCTSYRWVCSSMISEYCGFLSDGLYKWLLQYENERVRSNLGYFTGESYFDDARNWIANKFLNKQSTLKQVHAIKQCQKMAGEILDSLDRLQDLLIRVFDFQQQVVLLKEFLITKYSENSKYSCFVEEGGKLRRTNHEGLVLHDRRVSMPIKLVNRSEFSRLNFLRFEEEAV